MSSMNRLPNPPKVPRITVAETRSQLGPTSRGSIAAGAVAAVLVLVAAAAQAGEPTGPDACPRSGACPFDALPTTGDGHGSNIVVLGTDPARARAIRDHAEAMRRKAFANLLGEPSPASWLVPCEVHVHATIDSFANAVGGPPIDARGATSLEFAGERVVSRRIDVMGDGPCDVPDALDHELVHVVLADHFVHAPPPRWADEGLALLFDAPEKQGEHAADFQAAARRGMAWSAAELVSLEDYPDEGGRQRVFYGQSAALVRWLVARRDAATFIRFLDDVNDVGIEPALRRHYALESLSSVTPAWKEVAPINSLGLADTRRERTP
jgi:hypothetical protein